MTRAAVAASGADALARLDAGQGVPGDRESAARFEALCQADAGRLLDAELQHERERYEAQQAEREDDE